MNRIRELLGGEGGEDAKRFKKLPNEIVQIQELNK